MPRSLLAGLVGLVILGGLGIGGGRAAPSGAVVAVRQATPAADRDVPGPAECRTEPRSLASMRALATPVPGVPAPSPAIGSPVALPRGEPLDEAARSAITATAREVIACDNAGDRLRALALYSDAYLRQFFGSPGIFTPDRYALLATPRPVEAAAQIALVELRDARRLADGRGGAVIVVDDPTDPADQGNSASFVVFVQEGDRWLIDGAIDLGAAAPARSPDPAGTPVAAKGG